MPTQKYKIKPLCILSAKKTHNKETPAVGLAFSIQLLLQFRSEFKLQTKLFVFVWLKTAVMRFQDYCPDLIVFCQVMHHIRHG